MLEHEYSVLGGVNRARIGQYLAVVSSLVSAGVVFVMLSAIDIAKKFDIATNLPPSVLSLAGAGTVFLVLYWLLDRYAWKWPGFASLLGVPNLGGE